MLGGCAREPALADSSRRLDADLAAVLAAGAEHLGRPGTRARTLADETRPCPDGNARRIVRKQLDLREGPAAVVADQATGLTVDLIGERGYRLAGPPSRGRKGRRTFTMSRDTPQASVTVQVRAGRRPTLTLDGSTPCLPA